MTDQFAALREKLGIPADLHPEPEPEGPAVRRCRFTHEGEPCPGTLRLVERVTPICTLQCDVCGALAGMPIRQVEPNVAYRARVEKAGVPARYLGQRFDVNEENWPAVQAVKQWLNGASEDPAERVRSLLPAPAIFGNLGVGKTHLLVGLCVRLIRERNLRVAFRTSRQLLRELQQFDDNTAREQARRLFVSVDVLALDDLGAEQSSDNRLDQLADLVDERYTRELPILVATNFPPDGWADRLDARTVSRLRGMTFGVELRGRDHRQLGEAA